MKKVLVVLLTLCLTINLFSVSVLASNVLVPATSSNIGDNHYSGGWTQSSTTRIDGVAVGGYSSSAWASTIKSYLYQDGEYLVRVEYIDGHIVIEYYTNEYRLVTSKTLNIDEGFNLWGGFYAGEKYNFIIIGQENSNADDDFEVIRIIKYSKNWDRLGQAGLFGQNTVRPFDGGSFRCDEYNGTLYIRTARKIYPIDGLYHQTNMTIVIQENNMSIKNNPAGFDVSHSFNQFILVDANGSIITLDHGDGYPRAAVLKKFDQTVTRLQETVNVREFLLDRPKGMMDNATGASLGGLVESSTGYITVFNDDGLGINSLGDRSAHNVYISHTNKKNFTESRTDVYQLTNYEVDGEYSTGTPALVPTSLNGGYVLWETRELKESRYHPDSYQSVDKITYAAYSADGQISNITTTKGSLSDCQPIVYNGKVVWYVTNDGPPIFYILDNSGLTNQLSGSLFVDVDAKSWYGKSVEFARNNKLIDGYASNEFKPNSFATRGTVIVALYRLWGAFEKHYISYFDDVDAEDVELNSAICWAAVPDPIIGTKTGIASGYGNGKFGPDDSISRQQLAVFLYRYAIYKGYDVSKRADLSGYIDQCDISDYALEPMQWAVSQGLIQGTTNVTLSPQGTVTRAQFAVILMRFCENITD